jgi:hypothetical protein
MKAKLLIGCINSQTKLLLELKTRWRQSLTCVAQWLHGVLPVAVDAATGAGSVFRVALEHRRANRAPLQLAAPTAGKRAGQAAEAAALRKGQKGKGKEAITAATLLDLHAAGGHAGEMALVQEPVLAAQRRLAELLEEWPEHPILTQLHLICSRILGLPLFSAVKQALTGLELLLARAQVSLPSDATLRTTSQSLSTHSTLWCAFALTWVRGSVASSAISRANLHSNTFSPRKSKLHSRAIASLP